VKLFLRLSPVKYSLVTVAFSRISMPPVWFKLSWYGFALLNSGQVDAAFVDALDEEFPLAKVLLIDGLDVVM
jgi:hypothetical protein